MLQHDFHDKGNRKTPVAPFKFFLRLAQVVDIKEWEHIRQWMADVAHERIEEMQTPGLASQNARKRDLALLQKMGYEKTEAAQYLQDRIEGVDGFKMLMAVVKEVCEKPQYGKIVEAEYINLFGETTKRLQEILETKSIRDKLPPLQYSYLRTAELSLREILKHQDHLTMEQILDIVDKVVKPLGDLLANICQALGIHHITGLPLAAGTKNVLVSKGKQLRLPKGGN